MSRKLNVQQKSIASILLLCSVLGCATPPYRGINPANPQFERGIPCPPLDLFGDLLSKIPQVLFWDFKYGNHRVSLETESEIARFIAEYKLKDVKVRINQWAPHKEIFRLFKNPHIAWPYKIIFFPSTLIASLLARPFSGLLFSDYYDPASNTIHIFSDDPAIALHESGHAVDFLNEEFKGSYALARIVPGVNLVQERLATEEALYYLEKHGRYEDLLHAYKILYPAYATYIIGYFPVAVPAYVGAILLGHVYGRFLAREKEYQLKKEGKYPEKITKLPVLGQRDLIDQEEELRVGMSVQAEG